MDLYALAPLTIVLALVSAYLFWRVRRLRSEVGSLTLAQASSAELLRQLTARVRAIEIAPLPARVETPEVEEPTPALPALPPIPEPEPVTAHEALPPALPVFAPAFEPVPEPVFAAVAEEQLPPPLAPAAIRQKFDFEAFVGGNLLIKLGVLILVVGLALLLSWSLTEMGPAGRIAVGLLTGSALLVAGVLTEKRDHYVTFGRGLIAGGWAALYFTVYAMHGVAAAQVISDPLLGFSLLLVVAVGMVMHSLLYRSQALTAVTFFVAFFTLNLFPATSFSLLAAMPLTIFLLAVCWRFSWAAGAVTGLALTYGTLLFQWRDVSAVWNHSSLGTAILWSYWLMFEGFDLLSLWKGKERSGAFRTLFPLNACGFLFAATLPGSPIPAENVTSFLIAASVAYLVSALLRARLAPSPEDDRMQAELMGGGYALPATISAGLLMSTLCRDFHGLALTRALLFEGELLTLAGVALRRRFLQYLGAVVMIVPAVKLAFVDSEIHNTIGLMGTTIHVWTLTALMAAALFYMNRGITRRIRPYSFVAGALVTSILGLELSELYWGLAWTVLALFQFEAARLTPLRELRWAALINGVMGYFVLLTSTALTQSVKPGSDLVLWICAALYISVALQLHLQWKREPDRRLVRIAFRVVSWAAMTLLWAAIGDGLSARWMVVGYAAAAIAICEAGIRGERAMVRWQAYMTIFLAFGRLFVINFDDRTFIWGMPQFLITGLPVAAACYWMSARLIRLGVGEMRVAGRVITYGGALVTASVLARHMPEYWHAAGLAGLMAVLLELGLRSSVPDLRWQSYVLALWAFGMAIAQDVLMMTPGNWFTKPEFGALTVIALYHTCQFLLPKPWTGRRLEGYSRPEFSLLGMLLLTSLIGVQISGSHVTVAWALQAIGLLVAGFLLHERVFRLSGLVLFLFCVAKLFVFDLSNLETFAKIIAFIVLGLLLIATSWAYTRFREQVKKML